MVDGRFQEALSIRERRRLSRVEQFAIIAGREAWRQAGKPAVEAERLGVSIGAGVGGITTIVEQEHVLPDVGPRRVSPHTINMLMADGPAAWLFVDIGAKAGARTSVSACASGSEAIAAAGIHAAVKSTKSMTGHMLGASGALSAVATVLALPGGVIAPTTNPNQIDPEIRLDIVQNEKRTKNADVAVVNLFGFGGHNAALVFTRS